MERKKFYEVYDHNFMENYFDTREKAQDFIDYRMKIWERDRHLFSDAYVPAFTIKYR